jgi:hypothetical protein
MLAPPVPPTPSPAVEAKSLLKNPPVSVTTVDPGTSRGDFVMMFTTPVNALAPQTADAGPRTTSICLMSAGSVGAKSHMTRPKKSR